MSFAKLLQSATAIAVVTLPCPAPRSTFGAIVKGVTPRSPADTRPKLTDDEALAWLDATIRDRAESREQWPRQTPNGEPIACSLEEIAESIADGIIANMDISETTVQALRALGGVAALNAHVLAVLDVESDDEDGIAVELPSDIGAMAYETPTSILIRRLAVKNPKLFKDIFIDVNKTPTLAQYNPFFITFESPNKEILLTGDNR